MSFQKIRAYKMLRLNEQDSHMQKKPSESDNTGRWQRLLLFVVMFCLFINSFVGCSAYEWERVNIWIEYNRQTIAFVLGDVKIAYSISRIWCYEKKKHRKRQTLRQIYIWLSRNHKICIVFRVRKFLRIIAITITTVVVTHHRNITNATKTNQTELFIVVCKHILWFLRVSTCCVVLLL